MVTTLDNQTEPIRSVFANDEDFAELLEMFIDSVADRRAELQSAFQQGDFESIRVISHQLKGAGGGYGFEGLTRVAANVEHNASETPDAQFSAQFDALIDYLNRMAV